MSAELKAPMSVDEFLLWAEAEEGRYELEAGAVIAMSPERALHVRTKFAACSAFADAIRRAGLSCEAYIEGLAVRIGPNTSYEPDVLVQCGTQPADDALVADNPLIVVEVLSPGTSYRDLGVKLTGYFKVASVQHYLIVDPDRRVVFHHQRAEAGATLVRIHAEGSLVLDPPGLGIAVDAMLPALSE
jgi:Uma2 family endonuclease